MPTLFLLNGWKIQLFARDGERPHLHVDYAGEVYRFALQDFEQLSTDVRQAPAGMRRRIRDWGEANREALEQARIKLSNGEVPDKSLFIDDKRR